MTTEIGPSTLEVNDAISNEINKQLQEESSKKQAKSCKPSKLSVYTKRLSNV